MKETEAIMPLLEIVVQRGLIPATSFPEITPLPARSRAKDAMQHGQHKPVQCHGHQWRFAVQLTHFVAPLQHFSQAQIDRDTIESNAGYPAFFQKIER